MILMNLNVRDLPGEVHEVLVRRAETRKMSLRAYVVDVLSEHCRLPATDAWANPREEPLVEARLASLTRAPITRYPC
ncbi:MAG: hypothetical protein J2P39_06000, partial [Candidatus Dormibacteraeota bacterium]|nr:hypothetical protein [Candidatus Dormibacteraeota bacterium]